MQLFVLTREYGSYSDYSVDVLGVADSADQAKNVAAVYLEQRLAKDWESVRELRERWPKYQARLLAATTRRIATDARLVEQGVAMSYQTMIPAELAPGYPAEQKYPDPTLQILEWVSNPERPGDWHCNPDDDDERWTIFQTTLNALAPDGVTFEADA